MFNKIKLQIINLSITTSRILAGILVLSYILDLSTNYEKYKTALTSTDSLSVLIYLSSQFLQMFVFATVLVSFSWIADWFLKLIKSEIAESKSDKSYKNIVSESDVEVVEKIEMKAKKSKK